MKYFFKVALLVTLASGPGLGPSVQAGTNMPPSSARFIIRSWQTDTGLPQNTINAIVQTHDGYLWLGTQGGLARFDGVRFTVFGLTDGLPGIQVLALHEDKEGDLWIGTTGGGLSRLRDGHIETFATEYGLTGVNVNGFAEDSIGRLWIGTSGGLILRQGGGFIQLDALAGLGRSPIRALLCERPGSTWIATSRGLFEFKDDRLNEVTGPPQDEHIMSVYSLLEDHSGNIWVSIGNGKVLCRHKDQWITYNESSGLPFAYITSLVESSDGTIWAGSLDDGLYYLSGDRFLVVREKDGLSGNAVRSLLADREGDLWVGTRISGLNRVARQQLVVFGANEGLTNDFVRSVAESSDGAIWVATIGGGIYRGEQGRFEAVASIEGTVTYPFMEAVVAVRDGSVWWGGAGALFQWKDGRVATHYTRQHTPWLADMGVTALLEDVHAGLWIGTTGGKLWRLRDGEFTQLTNRIARGAVTALAQQKDGTLWVGSSGGGLVRVNNDGVETFSLANGLLSKEIRALFLDGAGTLWIGTGGGGLSRMKNGSIVSFSTRQGLGDDTVSQILEDDEARLWLGCNRGIFRVDKEDLNALASGKISQLHSRAFGTGDGLPVEECSGGFCPAGLKTKEGKLCFSTVKGVVLIDPRRPETDVQLPKVLLEEVLVEGRVQTLQRQIAPNGLTVDRVLKIPPGRRDLEFHFTGLRFAAPEKVRFRFQLAGYDKEWIEAAIRRVAYYQRIPPGDYVFRVVAGNANNVWTEQAAVLKITLQPHFWETRWFRGVAGIVGLAALAGTVNLVARRRYKRRLAQLETRAAIERERLRISQDMHDEIGSILTRVSILSDVGQTETNGETAPQQFERIGSQVRAAVVALDEIVWATNPVDDNLPRFAEYVGRFADECFENTNVRCWQEMPTDLPELPLRADVRHNVFLAVKEALNNVLKHSGATEVWLRLKLTNSRISLQIDDNGHGFTPDSAKPGGNGLGNMKSRLAECGGTVELASSPGQGVRIRLVFPIPKSD
jgi:ligand-binding sensor domain-containing protein/signal transduction histidine kinase